MTRQKWSQINHFQNSVANSVSFILAHSCALCIVCAMFTVVLSAKWHMNVHCTCEIVSCKSLKFDKSFSTTVSWVSFTKCFPICFLLAWQSLCGALEWIIWFIHSMRLSTLLSWVHIRMSRKNWNEINHDRIYAENTEICLRNFYFECAWCMCIAINAFICGTFPCLAWNKFEKPTNSCRAIRLKGVRWRQRNWEMARATQRVLEREGDGGFRFVAEQSFLFSIN